MDGMFDNIVPITEPAPLPNQVEDDVVSCQRCRRRKKRCGRERPYCMSCQNSKVDCVYPSARPVQHILSSSMAEVVRLRQRCRDLEAQVQRLSSQPSTAIQSPVSATSDAHTLTAQSSSPVAPFPPNPIPASSSSQLAERVLVRLLGDEQGHNSSFSDSIGQQLGVPPGEDVVGEEGQEQSRLWPSRTVARQLIDYYFAQFYGMLPVIERSVIERDLETVYPLNSDDVALDPNLFPAPDARIYRLHLIFCIVRYGLREQPRTQFELDWRNRNGLTRRHMVGALASDDLTAVSCIALLTQLSIMAFVTMNPYHVVGIASAMALEAGLHIDNPLLSVEKQDERRRVFWSVFCMDRNISALLMKPVTIPENIISTRLPSHVSGGTVSTDHMSPTLFFSQMIFLRRLQGNMMEKLNLATDITDPEPIFADLRNRIDDWWVNTSGPPVPGNIHTAPEPFLELHYNLLLANLYRPSRLFKQTHPLRMPILRVASCRGLELYKQFQSTDRIPQNYVHMYSIVLFAVSLLYVLGEAEGDMRNLEITSWRIKALADIDMSQQLLSNYCNGWPGVLRFRQSFDTLASNVRARLGRPGDRPLVPAWGLSLPPSNPSTARPNTQFTTVAATDMPMLNPQSAEMPIQQPSDPIVIEEDLWSSWVAGLADLPAIGSRDSLVVDDVESFLSSVGLSDWTTTELPNLNLNAE